MSDADVSGAGSTGAEPKSDIDALAPEQAAAADSGASDAAAQQQADAPVADNEATADEAAADEADSNADELDPELIDQLGIPMRREPTLDDVRTDGAQHRQLAFGCTLLVSLAVLAFWLVRGILLSE